jgi:NAD(P)-dependent dehydrogenase (short-subunit alcohol dehydrogenase family)
MATSSVLFTGANSSLAIPAIHRLLSTHPTVYAVLTVRNPSDANSRRLLATIAPFKERFSIRTLDLADPLAVDEFARSLAAEIASGTVPSLASIICNAFYWKLNGPPEVVSNGVEKTFQVNYLAHVVLVLRLLGSCAPNTRILLFASDAHYPGKNSLEKYPPFLPGVKDQAAEGSEQKEKGKGKKVSVNLDFDSIVHPSQNTKANDDPLAHGFQRYAISKLATVAWMYALNRRLHREGSHQHLADGITAIAVNPGNLSDSRALRVNTPTSVRILSRVIIQPLRPLLKALADPTMRTAGDAALDVVELAVGDNHLHAEGYFTMLKQDTSSPDSLAEEKQEALWRKTLEWANLTEGDTVLAL